MKPILKILSEEEISLIHQTSLKILREIGFRFPSRDTLNILRKAGAKVVEGDVAQIPEEIYSGPWKRENMLNFYTLFSLKNCLDRGVHLVLLKPTPVRSSGPTPVKWASLFIEMNLPG